MAWTVTKDVDQNGRNFSFTATAVHSGVTQDTLIDFSSDLTATVNGETFTCFKITKLWVVPRCAVLSAGRFQLVWPGTADQGLSILPLLNELFINGDQLLDGGLVNPKQAGFSGDLDIETLAAGSANDGYWIRIEGQLMP